MIDKENNMINVVYRKDVVAQARRSVIGHMKPWVEAREREGNASPARPSAVAETRKMVEALEALPEVGYSYHDFMAACPAGAAWVKFECDGCHHTYEKMVEISVEDYEGTAIGSLFCSTCLCDMLDMLREE